MGALAVGMDWYPRNTYHSWKYQNSSDLALKDMLAFAQEVLTTQLSHIQREETGYHQEAFKKVCNIFLLGALIQKAEDFIGLKANDLAYFTLLKYFRKTEGKSLNQAKTYTAGLYRSAAHSKDAQLLRVGYHHWDNPYALKDYFYHSPPEDIESQGWADRKAAKRQWTILEIRAAILAFIALILAI